MILFSFLFMLWAEGCGEAITVWEQPLNLRILEVVPRAIEGDAFSDYSRRLITYSVRQRAALSTYFQSRPIRARYPTLTDIARQYRVEARLPSGAILVRDNRGDPLVVRQTNCELTRVCDFDGAPPDEAFQFWGRSARGKPLASEVVFARTGFEIDVNRIREELLHFGKSFNARHRGSVARYLYYGDARYIHFQHTHPTHDFTLLSVEGRPMFISTNPLSEDDVAFARAISEGINVPFIVSAVTPNGLEYVKVFLRGQDVTGISTEL